MPARDLRVWGLALAGLLLLGAILSTLDELRLVACALLVIAQDMHRQIAAQTAGPMPLAPAVPDAPDVPPLPSMPEEAPRRG